MHHAMLAVWMGRARGVLARLASVVAEDEPAAPLAAGIRHWAFGRGRELLEHVGVDALVLCPELGIAQARVEHAQVELSTARPHVHEGTEGTNTVRYVPSTTGIVERCEMSHRNDASVSRLPSGRRSRARTAARGSLLVRAGQA